MKILILNGPNLNLLGKREPDVYGAQTLPELNAYIRGYFKKTELDFFQSNHEGEIIDRIQQADGVYDGIVLNAGAYTHYGYAIRDAVAGVQIPVVEVHLSNVDAREPFRRKSVLAPVVAGRISGFGAYGYVLAVRALAHRAKDKA